MVRRIASPLPLLAGLLAAYLIAPLAAGVQQAAAARWSAIDLGALARASEVSVLSATAAIVLVALGGVPLGYLLARTPGRAVAVLGFVCQLPLALPPLASGVLLLFLVGYDAPLGRLTSGALTDSFIGIVLAETFVAAPFVIIAARSAFAAMDPALEGVAQTLGRCPLEVFWRVSLPVAGPALLSGLLLAWLRAFGEFGATVMVAYHPYSLPVYTYVAFGAQGLPAMLPVLIPTLVLALAVMALSTIVGPRRSDTAYRSWRAPIYTPVARYPDAPSNGGQRPEPAGLTLSFDKRLDGFHLSIAWSTQARRLAILGPSGSGKSLTLKLMAGIERPDKAVLLVRGRDLSQREPAARSIAYVPQSYGLFPHLDLIGQLHFPVGAERDRAAQWIERLGLGGLEHRRPAALSLGQQQRVALARALMRPADLLLLDEPFSALDVPLRAVLRQELLAVQRAFTGTTVLVTHDPIEAAQLADEILILDDGCAVQAGKIDQVFRRPASEVAARLLGVDNPADGTAANASCIVLAGGATLEVAGPALSPGRRVGWSFPPARARIGGWGRYVGRVEDVSTTGLECQVMVRFGDVTVRISGTRADHAPGEVCRFDIDPEAVQVWPLD